MRHSWQRWAVVGLAAAVVAAFTIWPYLRWATSVDVLTTRRLISRQGVVTATARRSPSTASTR